MSKYLQSGGYVGVVLGGGSSLLKIQEACNSGNSDACKKLKFTEAGSFAGGLAGGTAGAYIGKTVASFACLSLGALSGSVCTIVIVGTGSFAGSEIGMHRGEYLGEKLYEFVEHD